MEVQENNKGDDFVIELKAKKGESWESFVIRVLLTHDDFGLTREEAIKELLGVEHCKENVRKMVYLVRDIKKAKEKGLHVKYLENSISYDELNEIYKNKHSIELEDLEDELESVYKKLGKTEKSLQRVTDENTLLRRMKRDKVRDAVKNETLLEEVKDLIHRDSSVKKINLSNKKIIGDKKSVVLQLSDIHYNFTEEQESEMVSRYLQEVEIGFDGVIPDEIIFAFTGDNINHRKYSKKYTNIYTQGESATKSYKMLASIIGYFIDKYPKVDYKACSVCGNESDHNEMFMNDAKAGYDNGDYVVFQLLRARFSERVEFLNDGNDIVFVFDVQGKKVGLNHGYFQMKLSNRKNIEDFFHKMDDVIDTELGYRLDVILVGHIHQAMAINNRIIRSGSWEGANSYSKYALGIADTYRTQNMVVFKNGRHYNRVIEF